MLFQIIITIGASQALALSILLLLKRHRTPSDHLLSLFLMLVFGIIMLFNYREELLATRLPICLHTFTLAYLAVPVFYQYVRSATMDACNLSWRSSLLHGLPFIVVALVMLTEYMPMDWESRVALINDLHTEQGPFWLKSIYYVLFLGLFPFYLWLSVKELRRHEFYVLTRFSYKEDVSLGWLNRFVWAMGLVWGAFLGFEVIGSRLTQNEPHFIGLNLAFMVFVGSISILGLYGLRYQTIFLEPVKLPKPVDVVPETESEESSPDLRKPDVQKLLRVMEEKQPHREPKLTIGDLAEHCELPGHQLSRILNEDLGQHFFDFVNSYRVETFKELVADPKNDGYTLLALAYDSGFNAKSTFNAIFKKFVGMTPSAYVSQIRKASEFEPKVV